MSILVYKRDKCVCIFSPFLSPDQRQPDYFCHLRQWPCFLALTDRTHTLWHQSEKTDHSKQSQTKAVRGSWDCSRATSLALCDHVFICKILPAKKNPYISLSARSVLLLNNQRLCNLLQQYVEIALCLNWIDECIVTAVVIVCLFFSIYYVMEL